MTATAPKLEPYLERLFENRAKGRFTHDFSHGYFHGYLFAGPEGTGKKRLVKHAAKTLFCEGDKNRPCGLCLSCKSLESGNHPDLIYAEPDKKTSLSVEYVREHIVKAAGIKPYRSDAKVFIIDKADWMTPAAQNALLKTLEEPPDYGVFMLCAENEKLLLPTVRSRLWTLKILPLPPEEAALALHNRRPELSFDQALFYAHLAGGSPGRAFDLSEPGEEGGISFAFRAREALLSLLEGIEEKTSGEILIGAKGLEEFKENPGLLFDLAGMWYRDLAVRQVLGREGLCLADMRERVMGVKTGAKGFEPGKLNYYMNQIEGARGSIAFNTGFLLTMEVLMLKLGHKMDEMQ